MCLNVPFSSPYGYLGQLVLFHIFVNLRYIVYYSCNLLGYKWSCVCVNLWIGTQFQLGHLYMMLKLMFFTNKSRNDMKAAETMEIKALIVSKSTYLLIKWPQLISRPKFSKLWPNFRNWLQIYNQTFFLISSPD